ncbi:MAG: DUF1080 domain-containing protein, partial [Planctomycetes bacterium]|nr:DUF1080 domain-containing protein [Planctomycetota bacterium]
MKLQLSRVLSIFALHAFVLCAATAAIGQEKVIEPFNGKDLSGWQLRRDTGSHWVVGIAKMNAENPRELTVEAADAGKGELINREGRGVDIYTTAEFGDCTLSLDVMVPQGSNSGIYLMGNYEVQVLDSWGKDTVGAGDIGGLYGAAAPRLNASKQPGTWQRFVIEFQAPRFAEGKKVANAVFKKVTLNGKVIHENVEMAGV